jgi:hypothetical protein
MTAPPTPTPPRRSGWRIAAVVSGGLAALVSLALLTVGAGLLWVDDQRDADGYLSTGRDAFTTQTAALATENLDVDLDGLGTVLESDRYGHVRLSVTPRDEEDLFVGIARTSDVDRYLHGTAHAVVTDVDYDPFHSTSRVVGGAADVVAPTTRSFWEASAHGPGTRTLDWKVTDGDWSVVVMNADGTAGVDAGVRAGIDIPTVRDAAWGTLGGGGVLLALSGLLIVAGLRTPRPPRDGATASGALPVAA